ncbi:MAG: hypothetical protein M1819_004412 [Sarea resinae]|nr:MAG: hypothetical protein M1819_004412 [Sarea resinae]
MPRPKKIGGPEPKKRSRNGCWPCKARKVKCGEEKPKCLNCERQNETCDYSIRLNWEGRTKKKDPFVISSGNHTHSPPNGSIPGAGSFTVTSGSVSWPAQPAPLAPSPVELQPAPAVNKLQNGRHTTSRADIRINTDGYRPSAAANGHYDPAAEISPLQRLEQAHGQNQPSGSGSLPDLSTVDPALAGRSHLQQQKISSAAAEKRTAKRSKAFEVPLSSNQATAIQYAQQQHPRVNSLQSTSSNDSYPTPDSNYASPGNNGVGEEASPGAFSQLSAAHMLPPPTVTPNGRITSSMDRNMGDHHISSEHRAKRIRFSPPSEKPAPIPDQLYGGQAGASVRQNGPSGAATASDVRASPYARSYQSSSPYTSAASTPLTPAVSADASEDGHACGLPSHLPENSPELRRLSVDSLLSGPTRDDDRLFSGQLSGQVFGLQSFTPVDDDEETITYGLDRGFPDLDISKNDDANALSGRTPFMSDDKLDYILQSQSEDGLTLAEFAFSTPAKDTVFEKGGYYNQAVPVKLPKSLMPLPSPLQDNPMNLLYFHHFLNHTARILVPLDCPENPFKTILPQMAVHNINLLKLLLAYSASHRARLLDQPEPATRIALWVQDVFPSLRAALSQPKENITNANLATAIMLASLEIISPNTFDVPVPWQHHLNTARQMILARGGPQVHRKDKVSYFLIRWFSYLDVLGSLSGSKNDRPLFSGSYYVKSDPDGGDDDDFQIDCLLGFTGRCIAILARVAELARQCDNERIDADGNIREDWAPSQETVEAAEKLKFALQEGRVHVYRGCNHKRHRSSSSSGSRPVSLVSPHTTTATTTAAAVTENETGWDSLELIATNDAFHWAGLVHLHRRVLGKPSSDPAVQNAVREIVGALYKVRTGGTAEACLLFPMFTAGCSAEDWDQRDKIMKRLRSVEACGMTHVRKARALLQKVWDTGRAWETLVSGEFFG